MFSQTIRCREFAIAAAVTVMLIGSVATGHSQDVIGRSKSKWGTTDEDLLRSFPGGAIRLDKEETFKNPPGYASVGINNFEIGRQIYRVRFVMDPSERRLMSVVLHLDEQNHPAAETVFANLEQTLVEKYGPPIFKNDERKPDRRQSGVVFEGLPY